MNRPTVDNAQSHVTAFRPISEAARNAIGLSRQMDRRCGGVRDRSSMGINSGYVLGLRLSITQRISRTR